VKESLLTELSFYVPSTQDTSNILKMLFLANLLANTDKELNLIQQKQPFVRNKKIL